MYYLLHCPSCELSHLLESLKKQNITFFILYSPPCVSNICEHPILCPFLWTLSQGIALWKCLQLFLLSNIQSLAYKLSQSSIHPLYYSLTLMVFPWQPLNQGNPYKCSSQNPTHSFLTKLYQSVTFHPFIIIIIFSHYHTIAGWKPLPTFSAVCWVFFILVPANAIIWFPLCLTSATL